MSAPEQTLCVNDIICVIAVDRYGRAFNLSGDQADIKVAGTIREVSDPAVAFARLISRTRAIRKLAGDGE